MNKTKEKKWYADLGIHSPGIYFIRKKRWPAASLVPCLNSPRTKKKKQTKVMTTYAALCVPVYYPFRFYIREPIPKETHLPIHSSAECQLKGKSFAFWNFLFSFSTQYYFFFFSSVVSCCCCCLSLLRCSVEA